MRMKEMRMRVMNMRKKKKRGQKKIMKKPASSLTLVLKLSMFWMSIILILMNQN
jgi:hypothetical protein